MEKKYCDFIDEITADELYEGLLGYGMFANKLPPVFTSVVTTQVPQPWAMTNDIR